ncbi:MAG TPA: dethiobiotin synthase [Candidatus Sulfopaludibacter sp.]|nr:dethiobiotin synthase [Candidatus Sulfopaludibacter sp.]
MKRNTFFITGTDTGVGKTVVTALLARFLRKRGVKVAALKPVCSGGRADARKLRIAAEGVLRLDEINPWHFRAPVAPWLAAHREHQRVRLAGVLAHIRVMQERFDVLLVEGAGGLLSPLGENFDSRDLITALRATPVVVCPNRLGAVNQVLLTLEALPRGAVTKALVVLMSEAKSDPSSQSNPGLVARHFDRKRIFLLPWLGRRFDFGRAMGDQRVKKTLPRLMVGF